MIDPKLALIALSNIPNIGGATIRLLLQNFPDINLIFELKAKDFERVPTFGSITSKILATAKNYLPKAEEILERADKEGVEIITLLDKSYPNRLKHIYDCPVVLYFKGSTSLNHQIHVAIVGTRKATKYGRNNTEALIEALSQYKPLIISGLAYGIDIHAHRTALKYGMDTLAVMGSGIDIIYPSSHKQYIQQITERGAIISENVFGTEPDARKFPARNRIIAGLSDSTIVIEAANKGGALITANLANDYNRDVFAIPGNLGEKYSEGCNHLIKTNKANLLTSVEDIAYLMNWTSSGKNSQVELKIPFEPTELNPIEQKIISILKESVDSKLHIDNLCWQIQAPVAKVMGYILTLEIQDLITTLPGKYIRLNQKYKM